MQRNITSFLHITVNYLGQFIFLAQDICLYKIPIAPCTHCTFHGVEVDVASPSPCASPMTLQTQCQLTFQGEEEILTNS